ncbi:hypothetical protein TNCT_43671 [Trichonephila clavata]|uniref:Uncharacterized protein n=1 Tax=Trichonephila clavata TaxID=2740835 RepID=A0A8X6FZV9_TRICU|nr:hypothetical protein TNCT_43671 [Trichonephila clavata]
MDDTAPERLDLKGCPPIIKEPRKERMATRFILPVKTRRKICPDYLPVYFSVISSTGEILMEGIITSIEIGARIKAQTYYRSIKKSTAITLRFSGASFAC